MVFLKPFFYLGGCCNVNNVRLAAPHCDLESRLCRIVRRISRHLALLPLWKKLTSTQPTRFAPLAAENRSRPQWKRETVSDFNSGRRVLANDVGDLVHDVTFASRVCLSRIAQNDRNYFSDDRYG